MMDPDQLVRELFVDQSHADRILGAELTEEQVDIQLRNRVSTARLGWQPPVVQPGPAQVAAPDNGAGSRRVGDSDRIVDPVYAGELGGILGAEVTMIENAGHLPHVERPDVFVDSLTGFLAKSA